MNMNQEQLNRAKRSEDNTSEQQAYAEFKVLLDNKDKPVPRENLLRAIKSYYDRSVGSSCWLTIQKDIQSLFDEDLRDTVLKLATEAINYDMHQYILKGERGCRSAAVLAALRA